MAKAKGTILVGIVKYLRRHKEDARRLLAPELHPYLVEKITLSAWYPETDLIALIRARLAISDGPPEAVLEAMGRATVQDHHDGIYSHLLSRTGTATTTAALWSSQHDTGEMTLHRVSETESRLELAGYAHPSREMCTIVRAYIAEAMRAGGIAEVQSTELSCAARGDDRCAWRYTWPSRRSA
jgi:hypothetical protein